MVLDKIKQQTTWNDASTSINSNFVKISNAIRQGIPVINTPVDDMLSDESENAIANKAVANALKEKQDVLVSAENIKTINGQSLLGEGNIVIQGGEGGSGLQYVVERTAYITKATTDWVEPEQTLEFVITEEQKEYNKETVRMLWDEDIKPIVAYSGSLLAGVYGGIDAVTGERYATFSSLVKYQDSLASMTINVYSNGNAEAVLKIEHSDVHELTKQVIENEEVYAAAVTDLNSRVLTINSSLDAEISHRVELAQDIHELEVIVAENEEVVANSYNDLNARIESNYQHGEGTYATKQELLEEVTAITNSIVENEEVIAATLNDIMAQINSLITRIEQLENA